MNNKLKQIIFDKLYEDLKHVEIIPHNESIWFIDREKQYWYLEYKKSGSLWWRWQFFSIFFPLFSIEYDEYQWIIAEWVEEVLNCKVMTPYRTGDCSAGTVEEVLDCKVMTPRNQNEVNPHLVEEVLNCKVITSETPIHIQSRKVEEVLNCKVITPEHWLINRKPLVEKVLNCNVISPDSVTSDKHEMVEEVLNNSVKTIENEQ